MGGLFGIIDDVRGLLIDALAHTFKQSLLQRTHILPIGFWDGVHFSVVSLAGTARGSQASGAKALGLLFCQQALCLSGGTSNRCSSKMLME